MIHTQRQNAQVAAAKVREDCSRIRSGNAQTDCGWPALRASCASSCSCSRYFAIVGTTRSREQVAGQHGEHHRLGHRHEQVAGHAAQEEHRHEHDADGQGGHQRRGGNLRRAVENRLLEFLALLEIAIDVLDRHRGIVHQDADRQRQSAQRHDVDRLASSARARSNEHRIDSGIETAMMSVDRQLPRNTRIMTAVRQAAIRASRTTPLMAPRTKMD